MIDSTMTIGPAASTIMFMFTLIGAGVIYRVMRDRIIYEMSTLRKGDRGVEEDIISYLDRTTTEDIYKKYPLTAGEKESKDA